MEVQVADSRKDETGIEGLEDITDRLQRWADGAQIAPALLADLLPLWQQLAKRLVASEGSDLTLTANDVLQEFYLKFHDRGGARFKDRSHLMASVTTMMRHVIVDHARKKGADKRGGRLPLVMVSELPDAHVTDDDLLVVDDLIERLGTRFPKHASLVELHYFGGFSQKEIADIVGTTDRTVRNHLQFAKAWMAKRAIREL